MKSYYRIMPGPKSVYIDECLKGQFIGADFLPEINLFLNDLTFVGFRGHD